MKIQKNQKVVSASSENEELASMVFNDSITHVKRAIDALGAVVRLHPESNNASIAKEAIANLSVILLDLKNQ